MTQSGLATSPDTDDRLATISLKVEVSGWGGGWVLPWIKRRVCFSRVFLRYPRVHGSILKQICFGLGVQRAPDLLKMTKMKVYQ